MTVNRLAAILSSCLIGVVVIGGLWLAGSPVDQRLLRIDQQRTNHLQQLSSAAGRYWTDHTILPLQLQQLVDGQNLSSVPVDPVTGTAYEYRTTAADTFELCAVFDRASIDLNADDFWSHQAGQHCFVFDLDPN
jgi:hypothetical protein